MNHNSVNNRHLEFRTFFGCNITKMLINCLEDDSAFISSQLGSILELNMEDNQMSHKEA